MLSIYIYNTHLTNLALWLVLSYNTLLTVKLSFIETN